MVTRDKNVTLYCYIAVILLYVVLYYMTLQKSYISIENNYMNVIILLCVVLSYIRLRKPHFKRNNYMKMLQLKRLQMSKLLFLRLIKLDSSNRKMYLHYCL